MINLLEKRFEANINNCYFYPISSSLHLFITQIWCMDFLSYMWYSIHHTNLLHMDLSITYSEKSRHLIKQNNGC